MKIIWVLIGHGLLNTRQVPYPRTKLHCWGALKTAYLIKVKKTVFWLPWQCSLVDKVPAWSSESYDHRDWFPFRAQVYSSFQSWHVDQMLLIFSHSIRAENLQCLHNFYDTRIALVYKLVVHVTIVLPANNSPLSDACKSHKSTVILTFRFSIFLTILSKFCWFASTFFSMPPKREMICFMKSYSISCRYKRIH